MLQPIVVMLDWSDVLVVFWAQAIFEVKHVAAMLLARCKAVAGLPSQRIVTAKGSKGKPDVQLAVSDASGFRVC